MSGRPNSVLTLWHQLFDKDDWQFALLDAFTPSEAERFVGSEAFGKLRRLEADELFVPRTLEMIRGIPESEMQDIRTASDIYWRSLEATLVKGFENQPDSLNLNKPQARKLFALLAFEMTRRGNFHGIEAGERQGPQEPERFEDFKRAVWRERNAVLKDEFENRQGFFAALASLGQLNLHLDFAVMDRGDLMELFWQNRTLQDFFSALWITRWASKDDLGWLGEHLFVRGQDWGEEPAAEHRQLYQFWRLATEMPDRSGVDLPGNVSGSLEPARFEIPYLTALQVLYRTGKVSSPSKPRGNEKSVETTPVRSTEMIYRSWPTMLELAGYLTPGWEQVDVQAATRRAQRDAVDIVAGRATCEFVLDGLRNSLTRTLQLEPVTQAQALSVVLDFLGEFPRIFRGDHGAPSQRTAAEFLQGYRTIPANEDDSPRFWMSTLVDWSEERDESKITRESFIEGRFEMSQHPVTNALYRMFDQRHEGRFEDYRRHSPDMRCPAIYLSWYDAWCVALWLGGELPTEHQWEYACRAQPGVAQAPTKYWFGNTDQHLKRRAWFEGNAENRTHQVGAGGHKNGFGLYDMSGNVWEWTASWHADGPEAGRIAGYTSLSRVLRGGAFCSDADYCRSACRDHGRPTNANHLTGVRVARALSENL